MEDLDRFFKGKKPINSIKLIRKNIDFMNKNKNFFEISQEKKQGIIDGKTPNFLDIFEDSRLNSSIQKIPFKKAQFISTTFSFFKEKKHIRVSSLHEKNEKNKEIRLNLKENQPFMRNLQIKTNTNFRRSATNEIRIKNLEILSKLKELCKDYLINPQALQGKIVKCLIKSMKTLNE